MPACATHPGPRCESASRHERPPLPRAPRLSPVFSGSARDPRNPDRRRGRRSKERRVRQAALQSPPEREGEQEPRPWRWPRVEWSPRQPAGASTIAGGAVSGSPLSVLLRSAPAVNHVLCGSPPFSFCCCVPFALFLCPRGVGPDVTGSSPTTGSHRHPQRSDTSPCLSF